MKITNKNIEKLTKMVYDVNMVQKDCNISIKTFSKTIRDIVNEVISVSKLFIDGDFVGYIKENEDIEDYINYKQLTNIDLYSVELKNIQVVDGQILI